MSLVNEYSQDDKPQDDFGVLPAGEYTVIITAWEDKVTKDGTGAYANLTMQVVNGEYKSRNIWHSLQLKNKSEKAVTIAKAQYASIREATATPTPKTEHDLYNKPFIVRLGVKRRQMKDATGAWVDDPNGDLFNHCKGFKGIKDASAAPATKDGDPWG